MTERRRLTLAEFKEQATDAPAAPGELLVFKTLPTEVKADESEDRTLNFTISTASVDRDNDTINVRGWRLKDYRKNPVILWAHEHRLPPIGRAVNTRVDGERLKSGAKFTPEDMDHPLGMGFGHTIYRMYKEKYLHAVSVGFDPLSWEMNEERGMSAVDFKKQDLLEYSPVPIPANPEALHGASAKGIDIRPIFDWTEYALDTGSLIVPRETLEQVHKDLTPEYGAKLKGRRIEIDAGEAWTLVGSLRKLVGLDKRQDTPAQPDTPLEDPEMEKQIEELTAAVKALADKVTDMEAKLDKAPEPAPAPVVPEPTKDVEPDLSKIDLTDEGVQKGILDMLGDMVDEKVRAITGVLD